jgi:hypothetical protein
MAGTGTDPTIRTGTAGTTGAASPSDGGAKDQAKDKAQQVAGQAQEKAQEAKGQARDKLRSQVDERSTQYGEQIRSQASDLRSVGDQLRQQGKTGPAKIADQAAERAERAGNWLADTDADQILNEIESFGRRNPWAVVAGGLALGMAASRFLKASSSDRYYGRTQLPARTSEQRFSRPVGTPAVTSGEHPGAGQHPGTGQFPSGAQSPAAGQTPSTGQGPGF